MPLCYTISAILESIKGFTVLLKMLGTFDWESKRDRFFKKQFYSVEVIGVFDRLFSPGFIFATDSVLLNV